MARESALEGLHQNVLSSHRIIVVCLVACVATAARAERWQSPNEFYSIAPPTGWTQSETKIGQSISYAFTSPDKKAEIRISATSHLDLPQMLPNDLVDLAFKQERGVTPIERIQGSGWDGLRREYIDQAGTEHWLTIGARRGSNAIFLTMKAPSSDFDRLRTTFESVAKSLRVGQEILSDQDRDHLIRSALDHFWGQAIDSHDEPIQPIDEKDRQTAPIGNADAYRVMDAAIPAGVAMSADLDWQSYYLAFMKKERRAARWNDKQIAFIGILFGTAQHATKDALSKKITEKRGSAWAALVLKQARDDL